MSLLHEISGLLLWNLILSYHIVGEWQIVGFPYQGIKDVPEQQPRSHRSLEHKKTCQQGISGFAQCWGVSIYKS